MPKSSKAKKTKRASSSPIVSRRNRTKPNDPLIAKVEAVNQDEIPPAWREDLDVLSRIIDRIRYINEPKKLQLSPIGHPREDFLIATISTNIVEKDLAENPCEPGYTLWKVRDQKTRKRLRDEFIQHLTDAAEAGAKLVCFNELAYPTPISKAEDRPFKNKIKRIAAKYKIFIIAGGYHDTEGYYNICPIVEPDRNSDFTQHAKLTSAIKAQEYIRLPSNRQVRYYEAEYSMFSVFICIDVYDPALVFRLMSTNHPSSNREKIEVIFVPSFDTSAAKHTAQACKDLSYATASLVFYVNCAASEPRHAAYLAGKDLSEVHVMHNIYQREYVTNNVVLHCIPYDMYHQLHNELGHKYSAVFNYLNGQRSGLRQRIKV